jgi:hypothetical protein
MTPVERREARMVDRRIFALVLLSSMTGCMTASPTRPVDVFVTRADTGQPAADVPVRISYRSLLVLNAPKDVDGVTDAAGRAVLSVADVPGSIVLRAGDTTFPVERDTVRKGGVLTSRATADSESTPTYSVRLVPRPQLFTDRVVGWQLGQGLTDHPQP